MKSKLRCNGIAGMLLFFMTACNGARAAGFDGLSFSLASDTSLPVSHIPFCEFSTPLFYASYAAIYGLGDMRSLVAGAGFKLLRCHVALAGNALAVDDLYRDIRAVGAISGNVSRKYYWLASIEKGMEYFSGNSGAFTQTRFRAAAGWKAVPYAEPYAGVCWCVNGNKAGYSAGILVRPAFYTLLVAQYGTNQDAAGRFSFAQHLFLLKNTEVRWAVQNQPVRFELALLLRVSSAWRAACAYRTHTRLGGSLQSDITVTPWAD